MKNIKKIIQGFLIGLAKIIPGVSGAMLAISLGVYEPALKAVSTFFEYPKKNIRFLLPLGIGAFLAVALGSKLIVFFLNHYYLSIMLLFIGLILGGIPSFVKKANFYKKKKSSFLAFFLSFVFVFLLSNLGQHQFFTNTNPIFTYFMIGLIDAATMIIPGISGTAVMMILGCYYLMLELLGSLGNLNNLLSLLPHFLPFVVGVALGIILLSRVLSYCFEKKEDITYASILGFACSSIFFLIVQIPFFRYSILQIVISLLLLIIGFLIAYQLENH